MIQAKRLGHVVLNVRNAEKSRDFYTQTLGLKVAHEDLERGAVFLSFGKEHHDLALFQHATGEPPAKTQPGLHHMAWRLDSFDELKAAYKELKRMGIPLDSTAELADTGGPHQRGWAGSAVKSRIRSATASAKKVNTVWLYPRRRVATRRV